MSEENIQPIKPTVGKRYILRNGLTTSPIRKCGVTNYIYEAEVQEPAYYTPSVFNWLNNGSYLTRQDPNRFDIVKEIE